MGGNRDMRGTRSEDIPEGGKGDNELHGHSGTDKRYRHSPTDKGQQHTSIPYERAEDGGDPAPAIIILPANYKPTTYECYCSARWHLFARGTNHRLVEQSLKDNLPVILKPEEVECACFKL